MPESRAPTYPSTASGTAWLPLAAPIRGFELEKSGWHFMLHGAVFVQFIRELGTRGNYQLGSINWFMGEAEHPLGGGNVRIRAMASAEALTVTGRGYPQLLQVAQPYYGETLTDRMHPHEMVSEAAVAYDHSVSGNLRGSIYVAAVGEPALGPVMYLHRPSAENDPVAPLGHHAQDVTHESFGVATVGLFTRQVRLEGSVFNGAHPDEDRTNFEYSGAKLNSYALRLTVNPSARWSIAGSGAYLAASGGEHAHGALHRLSLSFLYSASRPSGPWSTALVWGANVPTATRRVLGSALLETSLSVSRRSAVFGRAEYVRRTAEELGLVGSVSPELNVETVALGYARELFRWRGVDTWAGARGNVDFIPEQLRVFYGSRTPKGIIAYLQLRPRVIAMR